MMYPVALLMLKFSHQPPTRLKTQESNYIHRMIDGYAGFSLLCVSSVIELLCVSVLTGNGDQVYVI